MNARILTTAAVIATFSGSLPAFVMATIAATRSTGTQSAFLIAQVWSIGDQGGRG